MDGEILVLLRQAEAYAISLSGDDRGNCDAPIVVQIKGLSSLSLEYRVTKPIFSVVGSLMMELKILFSQREIPGPPYLRCSAVIPSAPLILPFFRELTALSTSSISYKVFIQNPILIGEGGTEEEVSVKDAVVGPTGVPRLTQGLETILPTSEQICHIHVAMLCHSADGFLPGDMKAVWMHMEAPIL